MVSRPRCEIVELPDGTRVLAQTFGRPLTAPDLAALEQLAAATGRAFETKPAPTPQVTP